MAKNLLIVESPNKVAKIQSYLGDEFKVMASVGHIRDLSTFGTRLRLGLDLETMEPQYINLSDKKEVIKNLKEASEEVENIYLATDPDREGEAIAWHIAEIIKEVSEAKIFRITFNEITKESILEAIENPRDIDLDLVHSQEGRRIVDRMIGFRLSYLTNKKISAKSAGRVKSAVLKMIIDRENEIEKFIPEFWWTINGEVANDTFLTNVDSEKYSEKKFKIKSEAEAVLKSLSPDFTFVERKTSQRKVTPPKPLEMATYLMAMYNTYSTPNASATFASQALYEKGLITYPRTDSLRISSDEFIKSVEEYVNKNFGNEYYEGVPAAKKASNSQDAHEAIRPVDITKTPSSIKGLKVNEKRAYTLIWTTTVKSFLKEGKNKNIKDIYKNNEEFFTLKHSYPIDLGFRVVDGLEITEEKQPEDKIKIDIKKINVEEHSTKPPGRYNPSSLIKLMKEVGIGRPSTYSGVTSGLVGYGYLENNGGALKPTPMAQEVNDLLQSKFADIINEEYTARMENKLDEVATGKVDHQKYLLKFWNEFEPRVEEAIETVPEKPIIYVGRKCPDCDEGQLIVKRGRFGEFIACDKFPACKHSEPLIPKPAPLETNEDCPVCGKPLVVRTAGRTKTKFVACSGFPKCTFIQPEEKTVEVLLDLGEITKEEKIERLDKYEKRLAKQKAKEEKQRLEEESAE